MSTSKAAAFFPPLIKTFKLCSHLIFDSILIVHINPEPFSPG